VESDLQPISVFQLSDVIIVADFKQVALALKV